MTEAGVRRTAHEITVAAPAAIVYRLIAETDNWPQIFPATVHVAHEDSPPGEQRLRVWDTLHGDLRSWGLRRIVQEAELRVNFEFLATEPPVAALGGAWVVEPLEDGASRVRLLQEFRVAGDDPAELDRVGEQVDRDSRAELAALKENVEFAHAAEAITFSFEDSVII
ncbi:aromatase/cyclase, partial [Streptomyces sp. NPDC005808]|uniref:aromatase/cyclase n=1 Tax=Streptomyces sp. NPDC005808 TaxID=3364734 RepID=UPI003699F6AD